MRTGIVFALLASAASFVRAETVVYYHTDALGSPVAVTDANRNVIERTRYAPYGDTLNRPLHEGPGYTGHVTDATTGLIYMQQRYYDPTLGLFLSVDPVAVDGKIGTNFNRYWYAKDNPYRFTDPDGRCPENSSHSTCIETQVKPQTNQTIMPSAAVDKAAAGARAQFAVGDGQKETLGTIGPDAKGDMKATPVSNATTSQDKNGYSAKGHAPANAQAVIHGHLADSGMVDQARGGGDAATLAGNRPMPNYTVSADGDRVGVHEVFNGKVEFRMVRGTMTPYEQKAIQENLNVQQQLFNPNNGGGQ